jgi:hypothetical protein
MQLDAEGCPQHQEALTLQHRRRKMKADREFRKADEFVFDQLCEASTHGQLCLVMALDKKTGKRVPALGIVQDTDYQQHTAGVIICAVLVDIENAAEYNDRYSCDGATGMMRGPKQLMKVEELVEAAKSAQTEDKAYLN